MSDLGGQHPELVTDRIRAATLEILRQHQNGIRWGELKQAVFAREPQLNRSIITTTIYNLAKDSTTVRRVARGILILAEYSASPTGTADENLQPEVVAERRAESVREAPFYEPFAQWLVGAGDEATEAVVLGNAGMRAKWGTPDVVGVYKSKPSDPVKFPPEIISAEIKTDPTQSIVAFGQAISYRLFSHKTVLVMPSEIERFEDDNSRLKSLCDLFGVGYILFDKNNLDDPNFRVLIPPRRFEPDMFFVNVFARRLLDLNAQHFDKLFQ
jgi:hypothetical protein